MIISAKDLSVFLKLAAESVTIEKDEVSIFLSEKPAYPSLVIGGFPAGKDYMEFVYLLLSHSYQAVYQGHVKRQEYEDIKKQLNDFCEKNADKLNITNFDSIAIDFSKGTIFVS